MRPSKRTSSWETSKQTSALVWIESIRLEDEMRMLRMGWILSRRGGLYGASCTRLGGVRISKECVLLERDEGVI